MLREIVIALVAFTAGFIVAGLFAVVGARDAAAMRTDHSPPNDA